MQHEKGHAHALGKTFVVGISAAVGFPLEKLNLLFQPLQRRFKVHDGPAIHAFGFDHAHPRNAVSGRVKPEAYLTRSR